MGVKVTSRNAVSNLDHTWAMGGEELRSRSFLAGSAFALKFYRAPVPCLSFIKAIGGGGAGKTLRAGEWGTFYFPRTARGASF